MAVAVALALTALTHLMRPVCTGSAGGEGSEGAKKEREPGEGSIVSSGALVQRLALHPGRPVGERRLLNRACCAADHQHEEDQEDEQEAAQVDLEDGHDGRQAQGLHQEGEEGCGDGHHAVSAHESGFGFRIR